MFPGEGREENLNELQKRGNVKGHKRVRWEGYLWRSYRDLWLSPLGKRPIGLASVTQQPSLPATQIWFCNPRSHRFKTRILSLYRSLRPFARSFGYIVMNFDHVFMLASWIAKRLSTPEIAFMRLHPSTVRFTGKLLIRNRINRDRHLRMYSLSVHMNS